tara:strand:- start:57 stop:1061 length:1005 start_codon:yes stop_codon:yes gene_type:complete
MRNVSKRFLLFFFLLIFYTFNTVVSNASNPDFETWVLSYKEKALQKGISKKTINLVFKNVRFLPNVIKYDRKQPEFFEDTITYVSKRASTKRASNAVKLFKKNKKLFTDVEKEFSVEKEILLALWGIETNFGKHVGKMDIISSLATLSFDKRRSDFFSKELFTLLELVDKNLIDPSTLYGSWAGAYGNFQFMPSTIKNYSIDYDNNKKIELKTSLSDALASAANYINSIGWKKDEPCFFRVKLNSKIESKYLNFDARTIKNRLKASDWKKKGITYLDKNIIKTKLKSALVIPDGKEDSPAFLVFSNYEKILHWNRSLRFAISVCTLSDMINNDF